MFIQKCKLLPHHYRCLTNQIDEVSKQQDNKFVGALKMAKVEIKTAEQRLEVAGQRRRQFQRSREKIRQSDHCSSSAFGYLHIPIEGPTWHAAGQY